MLRKYRTCEEADADLMDFVVKLKEKYGLGLKWRMLVPKGPSGIKKFKTLKEANSDREKRFFTART